MIDWSRRYTAVSVKVQEETDSGREIIMARDVSDENARGIICYQMQRKCFVCEVGVNGD